MLCRLVFILLFLQFVLAALVNLTIDDTFGDALTGAKFDYFPITSWNIGGGCDGCTSAPDANQAFNRTWHEGTFQPSSNSSASTALVATVPFYGNAVYIYCILSMSRSSPTSDMTFYIDGQFVGNFSQDPLGQAGFQYDVSVYSNTSLSTGNHTLMIQNGHANGRKSLIMLDYIVYTTDNSTHPLLSPPQASGASGTTANSPSDNKSRVVGAVLGTLFGLLFIGLVFVAYLRHRKGQPIVPTADSFKRAFSSLPFPATSSKKNPRKSVASFHPSLLVARVKKQVSKRSRAPRPPPKDHRSRPPKSHHSTELPYLSTTHSPATEDFRGSPAPLLSAAYGVVPELPHHHHPHYPSGSSFSSKIESIHRWQRQTMEETKGRRVESMLGPQQPEEVQSYYEETPTESHRVRTPPPPPRRYTVVNN